MTNLTGGKGDKKSIAKFVSSTIYIVLDHLYIEVLDINRLPQK